MKRIFALTLFLSFSFSNYAQKTKIDTMELIVANGKKITLKKHVLKS